MDLSSMTLLLFAAFSGLRIFSYLPQIRRIARDRNGASAISYATWSLWTGANLATALYAVVNIGDWYLASVSLLYAGCCITVIALTMWKRRSAVPLRIFLRKLDYYGALRRLASRRCAARNRRQSPGNACHPRAAGSRAAAHPITSL